MDLLNDAKRITIKVSAGFHKEIKQRSLNRNITMTKYILRAIWDQIRKEEVYEKEQ